MTINDMRLRLVLSALWVTILLNALWRDAHEMLRTGFPQEVAGGSLNGTPLDDGLLISAAVILQLPVAMVVLSLVLRGGLLHWIGSATGAAVLIAIAASERVDADDTVFAAAQGVALLLVICLSRLASPRAVG